MNLRLLSLGLLLILTLASSLYASEEKTPPDAGAANDDVTEQEEVNPELLAELELLELLDLLENINALASMEDTE